jgi:hypothetical protein
LENSIFIRIDNSFPKFTLEQKLLLVAIIQQEIIWSDLSKGSDIQKDRITQIENYDYVKNKLDKT